MHKHVNASRAIAIHFPYAFAKTFNFNAGKNVLKGLKDTVKFPHSSYAYIYIYTLTHRQSAYFIAVLSSINPTILHLSHAIYSYSICLLSIRRKICHCLLLHLILSNKAKQLIDFYSIIFVFNTPDSRQLFFVLCFV